MGESAMSLIDFGSAGRVKLMQPRTGAEVVIRRRSADVRTHR